MEKRKASGKTFLIAAASALAISGAPHQAGADIGKAAVIVGGAAILGCAAGVLNCGGKPKPKGGGGTKTRTTSQPWSADRQHRASVQSALNDFGYPVGGADGVYGGKTYAGMRNYQAAMGFAPTGNLTPYEEQILLGAHNDYKTGIHNSTYPGLYASEGMYGLLRAKADPNYYPQRYGNQMAGNGAPSPNYGTTPNYGGGAQVPQMAGLKPGVALGNDGVVATSTSPGGPGVAVGDGGLAPLPSLGHVGEVAASMQDHCDFTKLTTQTTGHQIMAASMTDPDQALSEQFCDARTYLMSRTQTILGVARATEEQLVAACGQVAGAMEPVAGGLATKTPAAVAAEASGISGALGLSDPAAAAEYGEVCVGLGYRGNDSDMALAGALMLVGAGRAPYAEMVGHHLRNGFGTPENPQAANDWYVMGLDALANNQPPAVQPGQTIQRAAIIRAAVEAGGQRASLGAQPAAVPVANTVLPPLQITGN